MKTLVSTIEWEKQLLLHKHKRCLFLSRDPFMSSYWKSSRNYWMLRKMKYGVYKLSFCRRCMIHNTWCSAFLFLCVYRLNLRDNEYQPLCGITMRGHLTTLVSSALGGLKLHELALSFQLFRSAFNVPKTRVCW